MFLAIDIGNTNIVMGVFENNKLKLNFRIQSDKSRTTDEYASFILFLFEKNGINIEGIKGVVICSVVPQLTFTIKRLVRKYLKNEALIVGDNLPLDLVVNIDNPKEAGADRLVNAIAVKENYGCPAIIIDFGTATTFDIVNIKGEYIGGIISAGVKLMVNALHSNTAKLPEVDIKKPALVVGKNTIHSIQSGVYYGYLEMVNGLIDRVKAEEFKGIDNVNLIMTGGLGGVFAKDVKYKVTYEPHLTLNGLRYMYNNYIKQGKENL